MKTIICIFFSVLACFTACLCQSVSRDSLEKVFVTGAKPTQENFRDWLEASRFHSDSTNIIAHCLRADSILIYNIADSNSLIIIDSNSIRFFNNLANIFISQNKNTTATGTNNVCVGLGAGDLLTTGESNTFVGTGAGDVSMTATQSTHIGYKSGSTSQAEQNVFIGYQAGTSNTSGRWNCFMGYRAGVANSTGDNNVFIGDISGEKNTSGEMNTIIGADAFKTNETGSYNTAVGQRAFAAKVSGNGNIAIGLNTCRSCTTSTGTIAIGDSASYNADADSCLYLGRFAGYNNNSDNNIFIGTKSGYGGLGGQRNIAIGNYSLYNELSGVATHEDNIAIGDSAFYTMGGTSQCFHNIAIGNNAGKSFTSGADNSTMVGYKAFEFGSGSGCNFFGVQAGQNLLSATNTVAIGYLTNYNGKKSDYNVYIGQSCARDADTSTNNVIIGRRACLTSVKMNNSTIIGTEAGYNSQGINNVFIGYRAGYSETDSNRLYIEASNSITPLIYGEFDNDSLVVNGSLNVINRLYADSIYTVKASSWADYVFNDDYILPEIEEKYKFVKKHKHLQYLQPADDSYYITVSEMEKRLEGLVREVEEMQLIIYQQNKNIISLSRKVVKLAKKK